MKFYANICKQSKKYENNMETNTSKVLYMKTYANMIKKIYEHYEILCQRMQAR